MKDSECPNSDASRFAMPTMVYEAFRPFAMPTVRISARIPAVCYAHRHFSMILSRRLLKRRGLLCPQLLFEDFRLDDFRGVAVCYAQYRFGRVLSGRLLKRRGLLCPLSFLKSFERTTFEAKGNCREKVTEPMNPCCP